MVLSFLLATLLNAHPRAAQLANVPVPSVVWDFEGEAVGSLGSAWVYPRDRGVQAQVVAGGAARGQHCVVLVSGIDRKLAADGEIVVNEGGFFLVRSLEAAPYRGRRIRVSAWIKVEAPDYGAMGGGHLLLSVQGPDRSPIFTCNPAEPAQRATTWTRVETVGNVSEDAEQIILGATMLNGYGRLWLDDLSLECLPK